MRSTQLLFNRNLPLLPEGIAIWGPWAIRFFTFLLGIAVVVVVAFFALTLIISLRERQYLCGDMEPAREPYPYFPMPYWNVTRDNARRLGMQHQGDFATRKNTSMVRGLQSMWITPDRHVIASIYAGSSIALKSRITVLRSRLQNGAILDSRDNPGLVDISHTVDGAVLLNAGIEELMAFHLQRIAVSGSTPARFDGNSTLEEIEKINLERGARLVALGLARWVDPQRTVIRMTLRGALININQSFFQQQKKLVAQHERINIPRAGS